MGRRTSVHKRKLKCQLPLLHIRALTASSFVRPPPHRQILSTASKGKPWYCYRGYTKHFKKTLSDDCCVKSLRLVHGASNSLFATTCISIVPTIATCFGQIKEPFCTDSMRHHAPKLHVGFSLSVLKNFGKPCACVGQILHRSTRRNNTWRGKNLYGGIIPTKCWPLFDSHRSRACRVCQLNDYRRELFLSRKLRRLLLNIFLPISPRCPSHMRRSKSCRHSVCFDRIRCPCLSYQKRLLGETLHRSWHWVEWHILTSVLRTLKVFINRRPALHEFGRTRNYSWQ